MDNGTYYCIIDHATNTCPAGVYRIDWPTIEAGQIRRYIALSTKVWFQGPRGGVKIRKDRAGLGCIGYITSEPEYMKEFMWVKLKARAVN